MKTLMTRLQQAFERCSAEMQQRLVWAFAGSVLLGFIVLVAATVPEPKSPKSFQPKPDRHLFTEADPRALGVDGLAAELRLLRDSQAVLTDRLQRLESRSAEESPPSTGDPSTTETLTTLKQELAALKEAREPPGAESIFPKTPTPPKTQEASTPSLFQDFQAPLSGAVIGRPTPTIRVIRAMAPEGGTPSATGSPRARAPDIPAGSLLTGTLLNGLDAPTGTQARKEPYPVLVRIKDRAILPNRFKADLRECFLIGAGYGDLSAERAYIRAEVFSCLGAQGTVIEVPIDAYAVGEDGKLGLRGRLVDKQGQRMAESLLAGFANSFSSLFGRVQVPVVMAGGQNALSPNVPYQGVFSQQAAEGALFRGTGAALDRLSNYYMDLAEQLFPVIEIDATRSIDFVVQRGFRLESGSTGPSRTASPP
jgi:conjugal transfer pilus assembly protein TraB